MKQTKVSILGTDYLVSAGNRKEICLDKSNDGECRRFSNNIKVLHSLEGDVTEYEKDKRAEEIVAHEIFHAYCNESGIDIDDDTEEKFAVWYMKMWRKMNNSILQVLDENGLLD